MKTNPLTQIDFYKASHRQQYPAGTELVYSNFTPRSDKLFNKNGGVYDGHVVFFGLQYFIKSFLIDTFRDGFFARPKNEVVAEYKRRMDTALGPDAIPVDHIEALHDLGYLPIEIRALPEGARVPIKVPVLTVQNTLPEFFWLTNYLETVMSCMLWQGSTSATIAYQYRMILDKFAEQTGADKGFVNFQAHDFSFRGMSSIESAALSGASHLIFFNGTDTVSAIDFVENYYNGEGFIGGSVPATEHSVMSMGGKEDERETFKRLITETYPKGIVSIVSDTWNVWQVLDELAPSLKEEIESRDGKVVFRPDSGNPEDIICGRKGVTGTSKNDQLEAIGALQILWAHFGGTKNEKGYKVLNPKVGLIYGDSINMERARQILERMESMGFCSSNIVFGVGSYTYQYNTRDTFGFAMKATYGVINGVGRAITKDPITDSGTKKSATGLLRVIKDAEGEYVLVDNQGSVEVSELQVVFKDGQLVKDWTFDEVKKNAGR